MIEEIFRSLSGTLSNSVVDFYLAHQTVLNLLIVAYGMALLIGHRNIRHIERALAARYSEQPGAGSGDGETWTDILTRFCAESTQPHTETQTTALTAVTEDITIPFIASPYFFSLYPVKVPQIIRVIGKKHAVPRPRLNQLITNATEAAHKE